ncbi:MAG TPA: type II toxin-antitoxin system HicB family antitoxin [Candidatus Angelobacter sp.]|nr:type II toxin-antitoxin system HicB family antitoxin [Candidatus Angelobacter sp.]
MTTAAMKAQQEPRSPRLCLEFTVVIENDGSRFHAYCPGLKGLHVDGATVEEALENASEAAECYVDSLVQHGDPLPIGPYFTAEKLEEIPPIPPGALLRHIEVQCNIQETPGNS